MAYGFGRLDPFGHLTARTLVQTWLGALFAIHCLWILSALFMGTRFGLALLAAMWLGLAGALLLSHPAAKLVVLGAWVGWWSYRFLRWPGLHPGIVLMMVTSAYVVVRTVFAWRRGGVTQKTGAA